MDYTVQGILQAIILEWVAFPVSKDLPNPGIKPRSPALHADSLAAEPQGKPFSVQSRYLIKALWNGALLLGSEAGEFCPWSEFKAQGTNSRACLCHLQVLQFGAQ